ncbi:MAG: maleylacetoacetate isomerase [Caulobacter sp.]|jgi:maleylacetoacetate isomerase|nr:maleylacetoacetate isomerase [Caulobacter sp.]
MTYRLHSYWRSSAPFRVRIGLNLKGLAYEIAPVNLLEGEQGLDAYAALNPQKLVPTLEIGNGIQLTQSLAILEWLEEAHPQPALLPRDPTARAVVRTMAQVVACEIHPVNNMRVMKAITALGADQAARDAWTRRWISDGFDALEGMIARHGGGFAFGSTPTLADCCLVPQVYNARRANMDVSAWPHLKAAYDRAETLDAVVAARPDNQPDAVKT